LGLPNRRSLAESYRVGSRYNLGAVEIGRKAGRQRARAQRIGARIRQPSGGSCSLIEF
jgi:hypothetical protein